MSGCACLDMILLSFIQFLTCKHCRNAVENNVEEELVVEDEWGEAGRKAREEGRNAKSPDRRRPDRSPRRLEL